MQDLLLLIVSYHSSHSEVSALSDCLDSLSEQISYAVIVNDFNERDPITVLEKHAELFLRNEANLGYGRAINKLFTSLDKVPKFIGILNSDLTWAAGTFEAAVRYLNSNENVSLIVPQILSSSGKVQHLCKHNPTLLAMFSRRFLPDFLKPSWLKRYDSWYVMGHKNYDSVFEAPYLSGCCMLIRTTSFIAVGGFDERYFLYLEDADITRSLSSIGRCLHLPTLSVVHNWGRGNYRSLRLLVVNLISAFKYFTKWGLQIW